VSKRGKNEEKGRVFKSNFKRIFVDLRDTERGGRERGRGGGRD
jgi:hypothetical protein